MSKTSAFFKEQSQNDQKVSHPLLFQATKNQSCLYLLGTNHRLPMTILPSCVSDYIDKSQALCCESIGISKEEINRLMQLEPFDESANNKWYDSLAGEAKKIIDECLAPHISKKFLGKSVKFLKDEWVIAELEAALNSNAMDIDIRNIFSENQKLLYPLDKPISKEVWVKLRNHTSVQFDINNPHQFCDAICNAKEVAHGANYLTKTIEEQLDILETQSILIPSELSDERNAEWIIKLKEITNRHEILFVAVGCGHLAGETGLLQWLQESGYTLACVNSKGETEPFNYKPRNDYSCVIQ